MAVTALEWLDAWDGMITRAMADLSLSLRLEQGAYGQHQQLPEGGFAGRRGGADLYYTEFAVRLLTGLGTAPEALSLAARYLTHSAPPPRDVVEVYSWLHAARLLRQAGWVVPACPCEQAARATLERQRLPAGGVGRPGRGQVSVTQTFIGALGYGLSGATLPQSEAAGAAIQALQGDRGGFVEQQGEGCQQTSSTAGAVCFLLSVGGWSAAAARRAGDFLLAQQTAAGGFRAHPEVSEADLLSTHNALTALWTLRRLGEVDLPGVARHLRSTARPGGGFAAGATDPATDLEYTCYGVTTLALLHTLL